MSERLTPDWTPELEQAFGSSGKKGTEGEHYFKRILEAMGIEYKYHPTDRAKQTAEIDFEIKLGQDDYEPVEVKNNLQKSGKVFVYSWINKTKSKWIFHVNESLGKIVFYFVDDMKELYNKSKKQIDKHGKLYIVFESPNQYPDFVHQKTVKLTISHNIGIVVER